MAFAAQKPRGTRCFFGDKLNEDLEIPGSNPAWAIFEKRFDHGLFRNNFCQILTFTDEYYFGLHYVSPLKKDVTWKLPKRLRDILEEQLQIHIHKK